MGIVMNGSAASGLAGAPSRHPASRRVASRACCRRRRRRRAGWSWGWRAASGATALCWPLAATARFIRCTSQMARCSERPSRSFRRIRTSRSVNLFDYTLYAANLQGCGGRCGLRPRPGIRRQVRREVRNTAPARKGRQARPIGNDGTVYVHAGGRIVALTAKSLKEKDHFAISAIQRPGHDAARVSAQRQEI